MAIFLNKKEQVLDIQLTSHGKFLLSAGKFKPTYYTFLDDNIIYDYKHANVHEDQKEIHKRITQDTPYLQTQVSFDGIEEKLKQRIEKIRGQIPLYMNEDDMAIEKALSHGNIARREYVLNSKIGSSPGNARLAPAWEVKCLKGQITGSSPHIDLPYQTIEIPQINIDITYTAKIVSRTNRGQMMEADEFMEYFEDEAFIPGIHRTKDFADNAFIQIFPEDPILDIKEHNADFHIENFEVEVFKVEQDYNRKLANNERLSELLFVKGKEEVVDGILVDDDGYDPSTAPISMKNVEHYFDIEFDENINQKELCDAVTELRDQNYFIDIPIECPDDARARMDIYGSTVGETEEC